jgi:site-specific recombinase XerC
MAGVDLRSVQELGGWKTLSMVQRYAHLAPSHLAEAVERLVTTPAAPRQIPSRVEVLRKWTAGGRRTAK